MLSRTFFSAFFSDVAREKENAVLQCSYRQEQCWRFYTV